MRCLISIHVSNCRHNTVPCKPAVHASVHAILRQGIYLPCKPKFLCYLAAVGEAKEQGSVGELGSHRFEALAHGFAVQLLGGFQAFLEARA